jgi:mandelate racemase
METAMTALSEARRTSAAPTLSITSALTVRAIEARAVDAPLERPIRTASGTIPRAPLVLVDVQTEEGVVGRAYVFAYTPATLKPLVAFLANVEDMIKGKPVAPFERARDFARAFRLLGRQGLVGMALSGLDMALWDALGHALSQPVARLLGGAPKKLPAYDSYGIVDPVADRAALERSVARGFRAIKIKIGDGNVEKDVRTVAAVRAIVGADVALMVDYNQSLTVPEARRRIARLAPYDLHWVEEPVPAEDLAGHAAVRAGSPVPIQTGENWWFAADMAKAIAAGASDFAMPDLMKIGGVTGWLQAAALAEAASLPVSSHIFVEASAHALAVTPTAHWLEYLDVAATILKEPLAVEDGGVTARGPGLCLAWDEAAVARYRL